MIESITAEEKEAIRQLEISNNPRWKEVKKMIRREYENTLDYVLRNGGDVERGQAQYAKHLLDTIEDAVNDTGR